MKHHRQRFGVVVVRSAQNNRVGLGDRVEGCFLFAEFEDHCFIRGIGILPVIMLLKNLDMLKTGKMPILRQFN